MSARQPEPGQPIIPLAGGRVTISLPPPPPEVNERLAWIEQGRTSGALEPLAVLDQLRAVAAAHPAQLAAWTALGEFAADQGLWVEAFAFFRTAYHRGLDRLRAAGWGGTGLVPWADPNNQPFLRAVDGLRRASATLGEAPEVERLQKFLVDVDPSDHFSLGGSIPPVE
jgi:hypothetical protein